MQNHILRYVYSFLLTTILLQSAVLDDLVEKLGYQHKPVKHHHTYKRHKNKAISQEAAWQTALQFLGYYHGKIDGDLYTEETFNAITHFHREHQEIATGFLEDTDKQYLSNVYQAIALDRYMQYAGKSKKEQRKKRQAALKLLSYYNGKIDGYFGTKSKEALALYKTALQEHNRSVTNESDIEHLLFTEAEKESKKRLADIKNDHFDPDAYAAYWEDEAALLGEETD